MDIPFRLSESTALFNYIRLSIHLTNSDDSIVLASILRKVRAGNEISRPVQMFCLDETNQGIVEVFVDRDLFPAAYQVEIISRLGVYILDCETLVEDEKMRHSRSGLEQFLKIAADWKQTNDGSCPKVLDIGGRARSGYLLADHLPGCDVTVLDIRPDVGVDVVADIHEMSAQIGEDCFDFIICVSVFEHLIMPWKAALEINKVLRNGGIAFIQTHQTIGLHDRPWDYFRFSDDCWKGIFNTATGFELLDTHMSNFVRITPMRYYAIERDSEKAGGFYESSVIVRKLHSTDMIWPVPLSIIVNTVYPG